MNKLILTLTFVGLFGIKDLALAGGVDGGGGKSVVCRDKQNKIINTELLDLYEGRIVYKLKYMESKVPWEQQLADLITKNSLNSDVSQLEDGTPISARVEAIKAAMVLLPVGTQLNPIDDSLEVIHPANCNFEQTVNYQNDRLVLIDSEIWTSMSETQKAALIFHEAIYRGLRRWGETDSRRARHFVAYNFAGGALDHSDSALEIVFPHDRRVYCYDDINSQKTALSFVALLNSVTHTYDLKVQIYNLNGRRMLSTTRLKSELDCRDTNGNGTTNCDPLNFLKLLSHPTEGYWGIFGDTESLFESGDVISVLLTSYNSQNQPIPTHVVLYGTSPIDDKPFQTDLTCTVNM